MGKTDSKNADRKIGGRMEENPDKEIVWQRDKCL
jgi:hypothetical protein